MTMPSDGAVFADKADLSACAKQPVVDKPMAAKRDKSIFFISYFIYIVLVFSFFLFIFVLLGRKNCGKKLSQSHDSAENQFLIFFLHTIRQERGIYQVEPFHDRATELLGDVVDYFFAESRGCHHLDEI